MTKVSPGMMRLLSSLLPTKRLLLDARSAVKAFMRGRSNKLNGATSGACAAPTAPNSMTPAQIQAKSLANRGGRISLRCFIRSESPLFRKRIDRIQGPNVDAAIADRRAGITFLIEVIDCQRRPVRASFEHRDFPARAGDIDLAVSSYRRRENAFHGPGEPALLKNPACPWVERGQHTSAFHQIEHVLID